MWPASSRCFPWMRHQTLRAAWTFRPSQSLRRRRHGLRSRRQTRPPSSRTGNSRAKSRADCPHGVGCGATIPAFAARRTRTARSRASRAAASGCSDQCSSWCQPCNAMADTESVYLARVRTSRRALRLPDSSRGRADGRVPKHPAGRAAVGIQVPDQPPGAAFRQHRRERRLRRHASPVTPFTRRRCVSWTNGCGPLGVRGPDHRRQHARPDHRELRGCSGAGSDGAAEDPGRHTDLRLRREQSPSPSIRRPTTTSPPFMPPPVFGPAFIAREPRSGIAVLGVGVRHLECRFAGIRSRNEYLDLPTARSRQFTISGLTTNPSSRTLPLRNAGDVQHRQYDSIEGGCRLPVPLTAPVSGTVRPSRSPHSGRRHDARLLRRTFDADFSMQFAAPVIIADVAPAAVATFTLHAPAPNPPCAKRGCRGTQPRG